MPTLQLRRTSLFWFQGALELGRVFGGELFCFVLFFCLFVCLFVFSTPKVGDYFILSLTSGWGFLGFFPPFKMFNFPTIYLGSGRFFFFFFCLAGWQSFLLSFIFVCLFIFLYFYFFCFQKFHPPPWYQILRPYPHSITQIMVDITSSTILNSLAIQWKI